jgi:hypothetical protein
VSQGRAPLVSVPLVAGMSLSDPKVVVNKKSRIVYRHLAELRPGAALGSTGSKAQHRVWKFGSDSQAEFEKWSKAIRANFERLSEVSSAVCPPPPAPPRLQMGHAQAGCTDL